MAFDKFKARKKVVQQQMADNKVFVVGVAIILLFLGWGILMMKLWLWIDKKNDCGKAGEK